MKNKLLSSLTIGTTVIMLTASVSNSFGDDHRNGGHEHRNGNHNNSHRVYHYNPPVNNHQQQYGHNEQRFHHGGREYIYRDNRFYHNGHDGKLIVATAPIGAVLFSLPSVFHTVTLGNASFYISGGVYYKRCYNGYEIVERPHFHCPPPHARRVIVMEREYYVDNNIYYCRSGNDYTVCEPPQQVVVQSTSNDVTIMVQNSNGSRTPVTLNPIGGNQWKGPKGEIYNGIPDQQQLSSAYGF
jgi:hypothetical protein